MLELEGSNNDYSIKGFISLPEVYKSNRNSIITIVNGRIVKNSELNRTINDAYHTYKPDNYYPIVVLNISVDTTLVDVNIHPTKMDIKFSKMDTLKELVERLITERLKELTLIPNISVRDNSSVSEVRTQIKEEITEEVKKEQDKKYCSYRRNFEQKLPKELTDEYENLVKAEGDYFYEHELNAFRKGFKLGMQFAIEGMNK